MSTHKHLDRLAWATTAFIVVLSLLFLNASAMGIQALDRPMGYEATLFDNTRVHSIDIVMDDWAGFIETAPLEEYAAATVLIDGEQLNNVGIRAKGNTSLSTVAALGSERYSFKLEFDHYDSAASYHGLDKLSLNNLIQDSTMMKDYLTYTMMHEFGAAAPLCSFVYITVNGEDWGLYLAVEAIEESFLERQYGADYGALYKPDGMGLGGGRGNGQDFHMDAFMNGARPAEGQAPNGLDPATMGAGPQGGFGMGSADVKLQYIDDEIAHYQSIWNNAKTAVNEADQRRLIRSLEQLSNAENIESVLDVEQVIRYFVVHNYVCNSDSYTGSMIHNYYLYEKDGQLTMLPWDYNLAYGTFQGSTSQTTINTPIDAPVLGGAGEDRPMWHWILSDERYTEQYHEAFAEFLAQIDSAALIDNAYELIKPYVAKDPTAFYSLEAFETGVDTLRQYVRLRSESIAMQLAEGECTADMNYVDASALNLSEMGSMGGMRPGGMDAPSFPGGALAPEMGQPQEGQGFGQMPVGPKEGMGGASFPSGALAPEMGQPQEGQGFGQMPVHGTMDAAREAGVTERASGTQRWIGVGVSVLILAAALLFAKRYTH